METNQLPPDGTPVSMDVLFAIIGELTVQVRVLQTMLRNQLQADANGAVKERQIQSN